MPLEVTGDHLLFVRHGTIDKMSVKMIPASAVKVGDLLVAPQHQGLSNAVTVTSVSIVTREGLYSPFTTTGTIMVNGVAASNYIALPQTFQDAMSYEHQHWLQHMAYMPYRFYCGIFGCNDEAYDEKTGLSGAVTMWLPVVYFVEAVLPWSAHIVAAFLVHIVWKHQLRKLLMVKN